MKISRWAVGTVGVALLQGCSSSSGGGGTPGNDGSVSDAAQQPEGGGTGADAETPDTGAAVDSSTVDASGDAGGDGGGADAGGDAAAVETDAGCSGNWLDASWVYTGIVPDAGAVILHAAGNGTQNYECEAVEDPDGGTSYEWVFTGPQADLDDCNAQLIGHHFASEAGAAAPEWQTLDGTYVIGSKKVSYTPDGGAESVPWLLLQATSHGGGGTLSNASWISRANTAGGVAPATACTASNVGATQDVDYTADYFFWGP